MHPQTDLASVLLISLRSTLRLDLLQIAVKADNMVTTRPEAKSDRTFSSTVFPLVCILTHSILDAKKKDENTVAIMPLAKKGGSGLTLDLSNGLVRCVVSTCLPRVNSGFEILSHVPFGLPDKSSLIWTGCPLWVSRPVEQG